MTNNYYRIPDVYDTPERQQAIAADLTSYLADTNTTIAAVCRILQLDPSTVSRFLKGDHIAKGNARKIENYMRYKGASSL